jgi:hypothetical protein
VTRYIKSIPEDLWKDSRLQFPAPTRDLYWVLLLKYGLTSDCKDLDDKGGGHHGGATREETYNHFSRRFGLSFCRFGGALIDPEGGFPNIPARLLTKLSDGRVDIL